MQILCTSIQLTYPFKSTIKEYSLTVFPVNSIMTLILNWPTILVHIVTLKTVILHFYFTLWFPTLISLFSHRAFIYLFTVTNMFLLWLTSVFVKHRVIGLLWKNPSKLTLLVTNRCQSYSIALYAFTVALRTSRSTSCWDVTSLCDAMFLHFTVHTRARIQMFTYIHVSRVFAREHLNVHPSLCEHTRV